MTHCVPLIRKGISLATLVAFGLSLGCSSVREVPVSDALSSEQKVYAVTRLSGDVVEFNDDGGVVNSYRGTIDGTSRLGSTVSIKLDDVKSVRMDQTDGAKMFAGIVAVVGTIVAVAYAILLNY